MKVFMLGWEFPPYISGGLGTACHGLTKAMSDLGVEIIFVLPKPFQQTTSTHVRMLTPLQVKPWPVAGGEETFGFTQKDLKHVTFYAIGSALQPYATPQQYQNQI